MHDTEPVDAAAADQSSGSQDEGCGMKVELSMDAINVLEEYKDDEMVSYSDVILAMQRSIESLVKKIYELNMKAPR